jgi:hypothetical protein
MISDCCSAEVIFDNICSQCGEHCEPVSDEAPEADYIPRHDDGEAEFPGIFVIEENGDINIVYDNDDESGEEWKN